MSFAEIGVKAATGELTLPADLRKHVQRAGLQLIGLTSDHGLGVVGLPPHHRDPFDRLLIAQARAEDLTVVTSDPRFAAYAIAVIDAA